MNQLEIVHVPCSAFDFGNPLSRDVPTDKLAPRCHFCLRPVSLVPELAYLGTDKILWVHVPKSVLDCMGAKGFLCTETGTICYENPPKNWFTLSEIFPILSRLLE
jgi:hypothetical protein